MLKCQEVNKTDLHLHLRSPGTFTPSWAQIYRSKIQFFFLNETENSQLSTGRGFSFLESFGAVTISHTEQIQQ